MTEAEWNACTDPKPVLAFLRGKASDRKLRLLACACCRRIWHLMTNEGSRKAVEVAERYADGQANEMERISTADRARREAERWRDTLRGEWSRGGYLRSCKAALNALLGFDPYLSALTSLDESARAEEIERLVKAGIDEGVIPEPEGAELRALLRQARLPYLALIRDVIGNPFHPVTLNPAWLTSSAKQLAEAIYEERAFDRMAILGDALEEAGCTDTQILNHCRQPGEHVRGCWLIDLLLGKN